MVFSRRLRGETQPSTAPLYIEETNFRRMAYRILACNISVTFGNEAMFQGYIIRVSVGWCNTEQNARVIFVLYLRLSGLGDSRKERDLPNFAERVSKFPTLGTIMSV